MWWAYRRYLIRRTRREARRMMRAARRSKENVMADYTLKDGTRYRIQGVEGPELTHLPTPSRVHAAAETRAVLEAPPNPNVCDDAHTGPLVIVYTD